MNYLIRNAHVLDPATQTDGVFDIYVEGRKIKEIGTSLEASKEAEVYEARGAHLFPGLIDLHTHFREPGFEAKETILTGSRAALKGGYVACVSMPNTNPPCDLLSVVDNIIRKAKEVPFYIFPAGTLSKGREGKELSEMADLKKGGIVAVSDDGNWVSDSLLMRRALEYASMLDLIVMSHCEDSRLSGNGVMNEGYRSTQLGLRGISRASEEIAVSRDLELVRITGARLHICHVSTAHSVELIRRAKEEKLPVTAEVTPHHLAMSDAAMEGYNTNCKINPPLRTEHDIRCLRQALCEGVIDCIATDHAPHTQEEKMRELDYAPSGTIGLETALGVILTEMHHTDGCPLADIVRWMSVRPAQILGLDGNFGCVKKGAEANLTVVDVNQDWEVTPQEFESKSRNSCFLKKRLKGKVKATLCRGKLWTF